MKLLVVTPDYLSHALPLIQIGQAWSKKHGEVVVATGPATRPLVEAARLGWSELRLGKGSNAGVIEATQQPAGEDEHLRAFFEATRRGPVATLLYQARSRRHDLLHAPDRVMDELTAILQLVKPDQVVVDHVAFGARLALHALGVESVSVVLGHPSALPAPGEVYGLPPCWPRALQPAPLELQELENECRASVDDLSSAAREMLKRRAPHRPDVGDLTTRPGKSTLYVYPRALHDPQRELPANHLFIGSLCRAESMGALSPPSGRGLRVTVALGSFLSSRDDVLATTVEAARAGGWRLALAHGSTPLEKLGPLPPGAVVAKTLPQVALLAHTDLLIHHGGNGSLTEAAAAGVPMIVLPFSTDQFAAASAIERVGVGKVLAPNTLTSSALLTAVEQVVGGQARARARQLAQSMAEEGGADAAVTAIAAGFSAVISSP